MSANVVAKVHVDVVLAGVMERREAHGSEFRWLRATNPPGSWRYLGTQDGLNRLGGELLAENVRSVVYRYDEKQRDLLPEYVLAGYVYEHPGFTPTVAETFKAIDCLEYQSCEHSEWELSESYRFLAAARLWLIQFVPGYEEASWSWDGSLVAERVLAA